VNNTIVDLRSSGRGVPRMVATSLDCWLISGDPDLLHALTEQLANWSNVRLHAYSELHLDGNVGDDVQYEFPDLLLLDADDDWEDLLTEFRSVAGQNHTHVLLFCQGANTSLMRQALRAGVQDVLVQPCDDEELFDALNATAHSKLQQGRIGQVSVFINGKGGMGATFLATSVAHLLADEKKESTVLIDADSQFGCCNYLLGVQPKFSLQDALLEVDSMDDMSLEGLLCKHRSGLRLISCRTNELAATEPPNPMDFAIFIAKLRRNYDHVIIDLSRGVENWTLPALTEANQLYIVVQQNLPALRDAAMLLRQIRHYTGIAPDKLQVIANRYSKRLDIGPEEFQRTLNISNLVLVPNDFNTATASINMGAPVNETGKNKPLTRTLRAIADSLAIKGEKPKTGLKALLARLRS